ncbi:SusC/RagA family TonB-linked outer membrane protein [Marinoscillum sp. MHG1-6]|uniref:SusC/RagA family TonB-linked outer membrane protein n=1 Tax=Marinoscillum sp. MHG1-6 TaxID=2959627 RepID=UPI002157FB1B|nr:SusC/RagA family TonB-linked outer membrane protein [Marinoscillum sp. MHG1-6]
MRVLTNLKTCLATLFMVMATIALGQQSTVTGVVTDSETGETLPGATVLEKGTTNGVVTDFDGNYRLTVGENATLEISFVGYMNKQVVVGAKTILDISLDSDIQSLEEVVVVGYGVQKKSDVTGALSSVSSEVIQERPVPNAVEALQGKAAGVDVVSNRRPGEVASVQIRGNKSLNRSQPVLYVVDGVILMGDLNDINPQDIESIDILKDASATAIYGAQGSNGVVLITTKKGKNGGVNVNLNSSFSFDILSSVTDWASSGELLDRNRLAFQNHPSSAVYQYDYPHPAEDIRVFGKNDYYMIQSIREGYEWYDPGTYTSVKTRETTQAERDKGWPAFVPLYNSKKVGEYDWFDLLTRTGLTQNTNISVSSSTEKSNVYFSLGYLDNKAPQINQGYERYSLRINGDVSPADFLKFGGSLSTTYSSQQYGSVYRVGSATGARDLFGLATTMYPMAQPYDTLGELIVFPGNNEGAPLWNPLIDIDNTEDQRIRNYFQGTMFGEVQFTPWLKYRANVSAGMKNFRRGQWQGKESTVRRTGDPASGWADYYTSTGHQLLFDNLLYVDKTFGIHTIGATFLHSYQYSRFESIGASATGLINDTPKWYDLASNLTGSTPAGTGFSERVIRSYMARLNYSLMDKYLLTASVRVDGASVLADGNKDATFPSFALAWKMHEEGFLKTIPVISQMKLRAGYGITGNQGSLGPYESTGPLVRYSYVFGTSVATGFVPVSQSNPSLTWEKVEQFNFGVDFGVLQDRITGSAEYYRSRVYDLLMSRPLPPVVGLTTVAANVGELKNQGVEITLNAVNIDTRNFTWKTSVNWATNQEKISKLLNGKFDLPGNNWFIGKPVSVFRTYKTDGLWQNTPEDLAEIDKWKEGSGIVFRPGQWKPVDAITVDTDGDNIPDAGDYILDDQDLFITGNRVPDWTGGMTNTLSYKNWTLTAFIYARIGQDYLASLEPGGITSSGYLSYARHAKPSEFWSEDNPGGKFPEPTIQTTNQDVARGSRINDGSFVAVRNISLKYDVPKSLLNRIHTKKLEVYAQVINPFLFGGDVVKAGINPDDPNGWASTNSVGDPVGGLNNNKVLQQSYVVGVRLSL